MAHLYGKLALCSALLLLAIGVIIAQGVSAGSQPPHLPVCFGENSLAHLAHGESWVTFGIREHVGYAQLDRANPDGFLHKSSFVLPGRHIAEALLSDGLVLNMPELMLYRWQAGSVVAWYPVSIGMITERWNTPLGQLKVISRQVNPVWHRPVWAGGGDMPPGPANPLGPRWIGLNLPGYGIHGTNDPTSIGRTVSHGCIRMFPPHVEELFDQVWIGEPVDIMYQTVMVGQDQGVVYMAVFPDIYSWGTNDIAKARARLASLGIERILSDDELSRWLAHDDGVARPLLGSTTQITFSGTPVSLNIGPTMRKGVSYLPLRRVAALLGAQVNWNARTRTASVTRRGDAALAYTVPQHRSFSIFHTLYVPVRTMVEHLGGAVRFSGQSIDITLP